MNKLAYSRNVEALYLHVEIDNVAAISLYRNDGFEIIDTRKRAYFEFTRKLTTNNGGRLYYLMEKNLKSNQSYYSENNLNHKWY